MVFSTKNRSLGLEPGVREKQPQVPVPVPVAPESGTLKSDAWGRRDPQNAESSRKEN